jgi:hypothetical protein
MFDQANAAAQHFVNGSSAIAALRTTFERDFESRHYTCFCWAFRRPELPVARLTTCQKIDFGAVVRNAAMLLISAAGTDPAGSELSRPSQICNRM